MNQLSVTLLRLGFLVLLWLLVLSSIGVLRADLYGTRVTQRGRGRKAKRQPDAVTQKTAAPSRGATGVSAGCRIARRGAGGSPRGHGRAVEGHEPAAQLPRQS